jgi:hypothetical protein
MEFIDRKNQFVNTEKLDEAEDPKGYIASQEEPAEKAAKPLPRPSKNLPAAPPVLGDRRRFNEVVRRRGPSTTIRRWRRGGKLHQQPLDWPSVNLCKSRPAPPHLTPILRPSCYAGRNLAIAGLLASLS